MTNELSFALLLALLCPALTIAADETKPLESYPKQQVHLFLLAGQSNMAGRGKVGPEDKRIHPRVFALSKQGEWVPAVDPIHYDKRSAGVGLGKSFALALAEQRDDIVIGLIPAACGGSPISTWEPGGYHNQTKSHPYDDAIARTRRATRDGTLQGILWHQGEGDSHPERAPDYEERLRQLIGRFRQDLDAPQLPFVIGQLGQFPQKPWNEARQTVNQAHIAIAEQVPRVGFVSSDGLTCRADNTHFNAESLRKFGRRYAETYLQLVENAAPTATDEPNR
ncbi:sialate O-acetylesterase [Aeoliella sp. ICT_H6.2]|uniref:Sialate O-acetylesterase n=1 Tax=Aeoliella straminimaris TaxID=2954799 RepID=A0A9X2FG45_9BACT|nr:sialate O-acetylesterase [Aeoliella straminimaris]MCO6043576.1 sialate O-acetylesterase [Aeoliella straminimaris]